MRAWLFGLQIERRREKELGEIVIPKSDITIRIAIRSPQALNTPMSAAVSIASCPACLQVVVVAIHANLNGFKRTDGWMQNFQSG